MRTVIKNSKVTNNKKRAGKKRQPTTGSVANHPPIVQPSVLKNALENPATARPETILQLQRLYGNRVTNRLLPRQTGPIQRKIDFNFTAHVGLVAGSYKPHDILFDKIKKAYKAYKKTKTLNEEIELVYKMDKLCHLWLTDHSAKHQGEPKDKDVKRLRPALSQEIDTLYMKKHKSEAEPFQWLTMWGKAGPKPGFSKEQRAGEKKFREEYGLSEAELSAIKVYTGGDYDYINPIKANNEGWLEAKIKKLTTTTDEKGKMLEGSDFGWQEKLGEGGSANKKQKEEIKFEGKLHADIGIKGLKKLPNWQGDSFRGLGLPANEFKETYKIGHVVTFPAFSSTSLVKGVSENFARRNTTGGKVGILQILAVTVGKDIDQVSLISGEKEILLLPGAEFKVVNIQPPKKAGDFYVVRMAQVS